MMNYKWSHIIFFVILMTVLCLISHCLNILYKGQLGGGREAIFSRFNYTPEFPFMSKLDTVDYIRYSRVYNTPGPVKFISGRPYKYYRSQDIHIIPQMQSTWLYPWHFPQEINAPCIARASRRCHDDIIPIKDEVGKMSGLAVETPRDIVHVSPCFDRIYEKCVGGTQSPQ